MLLNQDQNYLVDLSEACFSFFGGGLYLPAPALPDINRLLGWAGHVWESIDIVETNI